MTQEVDVVVVGLGVGGEEVGGKLAAAGLDVVGIERRLVGGECPYWGCIPSKMMIRAANLIAEVRRAPILAGASTVTPDWSIVARRIREEATDTWNDQVAVDRFVNHGGHFVRGSGRLVAPRTVEVNGETYRASKGVVLSVGSAAVVPPIDGLAGTPFWTNKEAIELTELPASLVVLGGGGIGLELAQVFARFGVRVDVVEGADRVLAPEEPESSAAVAAALAEDGVTLHVGSRVDRVEYADGGFTVHTSEGSEGSAVTGEKLLVATGRKANLAGLGLESVGLDPALREIVVDNRMRAGDGLWAIGDPTGHGDFTHMSMYQAGIAIRDILGQDGPAADYRTFPRVTFTDPEIGAAGLTEQRAREDGVRVKTAFYPLPSSTRGWIHKAGNAGFVKLVVDADRDILIGATAAGPSGGEVLSLLALAVHAQVPVATLRSMIYAYPTFHRAIEAALAEL
jgi:pyruvate/2-oxoglutarate dehydrogenase complex dihydrolipoamide dehydrogenase (E3) component